MRILFTKTFNEFLSKKEINLNEFNSAKNYIKQSIEKKFNCYVDNVSGGILVMPLGVKVNISDLNHFLVQWMNNQNKDLSSSILLVELSDDPVFELEE